MIILIGNRAYALFLYRADTRPGSFFPRVFFAKLLTNAQNVILGSLWTHILAGKAYLATLFNSLYKNVLLLVPQTLILCALFAALIPILRRSNMIDW